MAFVAKLGYKPDPPKRPGDKPDFLAHAMLKAAPPPPLVADIRRFILSVLDQGNIGSCVSNSIMQAIRCSHVKQGVLNAILGSRLFGYYFSRAYEHTTGEDSGTYLRLFFQTLTKFGFVPERIWPYSDDSESFKKMPGTEALRAAFDQSNPTIYRRIDAAGAERLDMIKRAIASGYAVCFGTPVSNAFCSGNLVEPIKPPLTDVAGGHSMMVGGYDHDDFLILNSWSERFGDKGWVRFSSEYMAWNQTNDLWIVEQAPRYSE